NTHALTVGKNLVRWDLAAGTGTVIPLPPQIEWPAHVAGTHDLATIAAGGIGGLAVYDATGWHPLRSTEHEVFPIALSADDGTLAAGDDTGALAIWDM